VIFYEISRYQQPCKFGFGSLGFDVVFLGEKFATFQRILMPSSLVSE